MSSGRFWHITDLHLDPTYHLAPDPTKVCFSSKGVPATNAGVYGDFLCDSPYLLIQSAFTHMAPLTQPEDFIIWTGSVHVLLLCPCLKGYWAKYWVSHTKFHLSHQKRDWMGNRRSHCGSSVVSFPFFIACVTCKLVCAHGKHRNQTTLRLGWKAEEVFGAISLNLPYFLKEVFHG